MARSKRCLAPHIMAFFLSCLISHETCCMTGICFMIQTRKRIENIAFIVITDRATVGKGRWKKSLWKCFSSSLKLSRKLKTQTSRRELEVEQGKVTTLLKMLSNVITPKYMNSSVFNLVIYYILVNKCFYQRTCQQHHSRENASHLNLTVRPAVNAWHSCHSVPFHATLFCSVLLFPPLLSAEHWSGLRHMAEKHPGTFDFHSMWNVTLWFPVLTFKRREVRKRGVLIRAAQWRSAREGREGREGGRRGGGDERGQG